MPDNWRSDEWEIFVAIGLPILLLGLVGYLVYLLGKRSRKAVLVLVAAATVSVVAISIYGINRGDLKGLFGLLIYLLALGLTAPIWLSSDKKDTTPRRKRRPSIGEEGSDCETGVRRRSAGR